VCIKYVNKTYIRKINTNLYYSKEILLFNLKSKNSNQNSLWFFLKLSKDHKHLAVKGAADVIKFVSTKYSGQTIAQHLINRTESHAFS